jgi:hypothetical protein
VNGRLIEMTRMPARTIMFLSSFSPLLVVFALLDSWGRGWPNVLCLSLAIISPVLLWLVFSAKSKISPIHISVKVAKRKDIESLTYVATFLVPFLTVSADAPRKQLALGVFVLLIYILYVKGEVYFWNPVLTLCGYHTMELELATGEEIVLITRRDHVRPSLEVKAVTFTHHVYWESKSEY